MVQRKTCHFTGHVQGVGFRYTVQNIALRYNVGGYVKNLPDGRVELVMEGPDQEMNHLVQDVKQRMNGYIHGTEEQVQPASGEFNYFMIKQCCR